MLRVLAEEAAVAELSAGLDELVAEGARRMLAAALEAEVEAYVESLAEERDGDGHRLVVRNGHAEPRSVDTGAGPIEVQAPRVNDRRVDEVTGERQRGQVAQGGREGHQHQAQLLAFFDLPAEHRIHLKTTNPIESTFATVRLRTKVTKGPGSRAAGLAMAYKLIESAQTRWRAVNAPQLVALVRAGVVFEKG